MKWIEYLKKISKLLKKEIRALILAYKDRRVGLTARLVIILVVAYAASPIDLIPDFIPVLGLLDDLILLPLGIALAIKLIPNDVLAECRAKAEENDRPLKKNWGVGIVILLVWIFLGFIVGKAIVGLILGFKS